MSEKIADKTISESKIEEISENTLYELLESFSNMPIEEATKFIIKFGENMEW